MNGFSLLPVTRNGLVHIIARMRAKDREEIFATRPDDSKKALTEYCMAIANAPNSYTRLAYWDDKPVAVFGAIEPWPTVAEVWAFGTDDFQKVGFALTRHIRKTMIPYLLHKGLRRAQCRSLATHTEAHEWLRSLGAKQEDERPLRSWGKNGEDFVLFEWHRENLVSREAA